MGISKSDARRLGIDAVELGAQVLRGEVKIGPNGDVTVNGTNIAEWLAQHAETDLILIAAPVGPSVTESEIKTCYTCGRDYKGENCPHCAEARARLRGGFR